MEKQMVKEIHRVLSLPCLEVSGHLWNAMESENYHLGFRVLQLYPNRTMQILRLKVRKGIPLLEGIVASQPISFQQLIHDLNS